MKIETTQMGSVMVLTPQGAIAQDDVDEFTGLVEEYRRKTNGRLVLDMTQISFLDSRGVEAIWDFADRQHESGRATKIASVPELCREILELTGVSGHVDIFDSCESAVRSFV